MTKVSCSSEAGDIHLTYCMNIHPGEDWDSVFANVQTHALAVRERVGEDGPFGLGLRLSAEAAAALEQGGKLHDFKAYLEDNNLYVFTINGFPFGQFHDACVKENVYEPDWATPERVEYTRSLIRILVELLPEGVPGSISTLPGAYGRRLASARYETIIRNMTETALYCTQVAHENNRECRLAIEPEPGCVWESIDDLTRLFTVDFAKQFSKIKAGKADAARQSLGVCVDTCHGAVLFENLSESLNKLRENAIPVAKIQLSAGLICPPDVAALQQLEAFDEPVYLHQCAIHGSEGVQRFADLREALAVARKFDNWDEMRVHFHVPLFVPHYGALKSTGTLMGRDFFDLIRNGVCPNLEVETYSFGVLPEKYQGGGVDDNIAKEMLWVIENLTSSAAE